MVKQTYERINDAWTAFKPGPGVIGMLYQAPDAQKGKERITASVIINVMTAYLHRFGTFPKAILVSKGEDIERLAKEVADAPIGYADFITPGYGYIFLQHGEEISKKQPQGHGD